MQSLNDLMQFDHVIRVNEDGSVDDDFPTVYAPEVFVNADKDGSIFDTYERQMVEEVYAQGWYMLSGWSGQYSYQGSIMHDSEYVGGALEKHILSEPGYYARVVVYTIGEYDGDNIAGWAIVQKVEE